MLIVRRVMSCYFTLPVELKPHSIELSFHISYVLYCPLLGRNISLYSSIFSRQSKRVPSHWVNHLFSFKLIISCQDIADSIYSNMPHVYVSRWIRKLAQNIQFLFFIIYLLSWLLLFPLVLPFRVNFFKLIGEWLKFEVYKFVIRGFPPLIDDHNLIQRLII